MSRNKRVLGFFLGVYGLYKLLATWIELNQEVEVKKQHAPISKAQNLTLYTKSEQNLSALALHALWDIPPYVPPKPKEVVEHNKSKESKETNSIPLFQLRNQNGFYTIIIEKKEFDFLGVAQQGGEAFALFFVPSKKPNEQIQRYKEGERIHQKVQLHKIKANTLLLIDTQSYKKIEIPYFLVKEDEFKPKEHNESTTP